MSAEGVSTSLILLVSNQSLITSPVDIEVRIDGSVVVHEEFDVSGEQPLQHNWKRFDLSLSRGPHVIEASSSNGEAEFESRFEIAGQEGQTATLAYWHDAPRFGETSKRFFTFEIRREVGGVY